MINKTQVTTNDEVGNKPSSNEKEQPVGETTSIVENDAPKISYASMTKQGKSSLLTANQCPLQDCNDCCKF